MDTDYRPQLRHTIDIRVLSRLACKQQGTDNT